MSTKQEIKFWIVCFLFIASICGVVWWGSLEKSSTVHTWKWNGKGWTISNYSSMPESVNNPYGFLLGYVAEGRSFTMVIPKLNNRMQGEARIHWWK